MWFDDFESPVGRLVVAGDERGLSRVLLRPERGDTSEWRRDPAVVRDAREQIQQYFAGERRTFELILRPEGTPFQLKVWHMLAEIPYGETWSYADVADRIGAPKAVRAVGAANGRNPLPLVLPCHRVIGSNGRLTGFGGGLPMKQFLLEHEGRHHAWSLTSPRERRSLVETR